MLAGTCFATELHFRCFTMSHGTSVAVKPDMNFLCATTMNPGRPTPPLLDVILKVLLSIVGASYMAQTLGWF